MLLTIAQVGALVSTLAFALSWFIPRRAGHKQDCWGPTRGFARIKRSLEHRGASRPAAYLLTEVVSGALHAPIGFFLGFLPTAQLSYALWGAACVMLFWLGMGLGRAVIIQNFERRRSAIGTEDEAVAAFLENPLPCLKGHAGTDPWSDSQCENVYVVSRGRQIAYAHTIQINKADHAATIGHLAVERGLERRGVARRLAHAMRNELAWRYGVRVIRFAEYSARYDVAGYPAFFRSLGAHPVGNASGGGDDWVWGG